MNSPEENTETPNVTHVIECTGQGCHLCAWSAQKERAQYQQFLTFDRMLARYGTVEQAQTDGWVLMAHWNGLGRISPVPPLEWRRDTLQRIEQLPPKQRQKAWDQAMAEWYEQADSERSQ